MLQARSLTNTCQRRLYILYGNGSGELREDKLSFLVNGR